MICSASGSPRKTGDRHSEGTALNNLRKALRRAGRHDEAITAHQDAIAIYRETEGREREGIAQANLDAAVAARYGDERLGLVDNKVHGEEQERPAGRRAKAAWRPFPHAACGPSFSELGTVVFVPLSSRKGTWSARCALPIVQLGRFGRPGRVRQGW